MGIDREKFMGADIITLKNDSMEVVLTNYGAIIVAICVKDRNGDWRDVTLGYDSLDGYRNDTVFLGASVGRYANRIHAGKFTLNGKTYTLDCNDGGKNHLHGGFNGFNRQLWASRTAGNTATFSITSPDGDGGYPGEVAVEARYTLNDTTLSIEYSAISDSDTIINPTNHSYFNLNGHASGSVMSHELAVYAPTVVAVDADSIPTGELLPVEGTCFDFTKPHVVGERVDDPMMALQRGYDHCYMGISGKAALLYAPESGIELRVDTTLPGMQVYCGNYLKGEIGKGGAVYKPRTGICLETQVAPDSPNQWPDDCLLKAGVRYRNTTSFTFGVRK